MGCHRQTNIYHVHFGSATEWLPCCSNYTRINKMSQQGHANSVSTSTVLSLLIIFLLVFDSSLTSSSYFLFIEFILHIAYKIQHSYYLYLGMTLDAKLRWKAHVRKKREELDLRYKKNVLVMNLDAKLWWKAHVKKKQGELEPRYKKKCIGYDLRR
jgi:hypothetical protein